MTNRGSRSPLVELACAVACCGVELVTRVEVFPALLANVALMPGAAVGGGLINKLGTLGGRYRGNEGLCEPI